MMISNRYIFWNFISAFTIVITQARSQSLSPILEPTSSAKDGIFVGEISDPCKQQERSITVEEDTTSDYVPWSFDDETMMETEESLDHQHHRQLGSWKLYDCCEGKLKTDEYKSTSCESKSSVLTQSDAKGTGWYLCCRLGSQDGYKIKSYKTIFGTKNWYYKCCKIKK